MEYNWAEMQQYPNPNPNPNSDFSFIQTANYSASYTHNINSDPYQPPSIDPQNALFLPQPQPLPPPQPRPPGVDPPYVPQLLTYAQQPVSFEHQQGAAAASYYPDPNLAWAAAVAQYGVAPYAAGVSAPNPAIQSQRKTWKKLPSKTKVVQSAWCEVCKIDCNSKGVLDQDKLGKKHKKNLEKLKAAATPVPVPVPVPVPAPAPAPAPVAAPPAIVATSPAIVAPAAASTEAIFTSLPPSALGPVDKPIIGPEENPDRATTSSSKKARKKAAARTEDLETKRRKVLEGGAAADGVRACSICNVVCNSDTVYNYHLAGQRHALMIKKHASTAEVAPAM
ncbi:hypothetical protein Salat_2173600 [Sesamum alatum]|uniref:U1-type domain-containing protein n=1 Tax=Sesamum alatum TaxID=300844 RepID=A0AAE1XT88_9LAMI|nr:hypothetical protein Salat_2173600 [Sesamum alatum]